MAGLIPAPFPATEPFAPFPTKILFSMAFDWRAGTYLTRTFGAPTLAKTWTLSFWVKRANLDQLQCVMSDGNGAVNPGRIRFDATNQLRVIGTSGTPDVLQAAHQQDCTGWVHVVIRYNADQATAANRIRLYINGHRISSTNGLDAAVFPVLGAAMGLFNSARTHSIGRHSTTDTDYFDGYLADFHFVDGQDLSPGNFAELEAVTGLWVPSRYIGTFGNNGFHLDFSDPLDLGKDVSGNGNHWTLVNGDGTNQVPDSPTNNWAVIAANAQVGLFGVNKGGLAFRGTNNSAGQLGHATIALPNEGKWYWEISVDTIVTGTFIPMFGAVRLPFKAASSVEIGRVAASHEGFAYQFNGNLNDHGTVSVALLPTFGNGDVIGIAVDMDTRRAFLRKNGVWVGGFDQPIVLPVGGEYVPAVSIYHTSSRYRANFGQLPFAHAAPQGFQGLRALALPEPTIRRVYEHVEFSRYDGTGLDQNIGPLEFAPDFAQIKSAFQAENNRILDTVRGATKALVSNSNAAEVTELTGLTEFRTDGFRVGTGAGGYNDAGQFFDQFLFKRGVLEGFDIVTYVGNGVAGRTVAHGLEDEPEFMIVKAVDAVSDWAVYHHESSNTPEAERLTLNTTSAVAADTAAWNNTKPSASNFTVGASALTNSNGVNYVAYLWRGVPGFSKFGHYIGNGNANGPVVFMGLKPYSFMTKNAGAVGDWRQFMTGFSVPDGNPNMFYQAPNTADGRAISADLADYLAQGIKLRTADAAMNTAAVRYIYAAWAEWPGNWSMGVGNLPDYFF